MEIREDQQDPRGTMFTRTNIIITVCHCYLINLWLWNSSSYEQCFSWVLLCTKPRYHRSHSHRHKSSVVTYFWTPRVGDGVYLFWTECRSLTHVCWKIDKNRERNIFFRNPVWAVFCSLYPSPLLPKSSGFLRLISSLHNAKFVPSLSGL